MSDNSSAKFRNSKNDDGQAWIKMAAKSVFKK